MERPSSSVSKFSRKILCLNESSRFSLITGFAKYIHCGITRASGYCARSRTRKRGVYSPLFLIWKLSGKWCPVLDLENLNSSFLKPQSFQMESLKPITAVIHWDDWMIFMDLENASFHIPVAKVHQCFLRFFFAGNHFQFRCLPFGLNSASRTFTKVLISDRLASTKGQGSFAAALRLSS